MIKFQIHLSIFMARRGGREVLQTSSLGNGAISGTILRWFLKSNFHFLMAQKLKTLIFRLEI
jgi:hypothetical protein